MAKFTALIPSSKYPEPVPITLSIDTGPLPAPNGRYVRKLSMMACDNNGTLFPTVTLPVMASTLAVISVCTLSINVTNDAPVKELRPGAR